MYLIVILFRPALQERRGKLRRGSRHKSTSVTAAAGVVSAAGIAEVLEGDDETQVLL